ncbi:unannotated protein [freshwater metagenome]|uniref:Unannotated protein n=1 Tax=freshwater metagenome TaxID=449393 RepID=A0A6J7RYZ7_9ZZZZ
MTTNETLRELAARAKETGALALDTEFMGEGRYRTELCLVQVAVDAAQDGEPAWTELIDPFDRDINPAPIVELIDDPDVEIIVHAGRQDLALLRRLWHAHPRNCFDTQVAAAFAGMRAQIGYEALLKDLLKVQLDKGASFSRWDARPLSDEQQRYARGDVLQLGEVATVLKQRLLERGRLDWAREECLPLEASTDERDIDVVFNKLPKVNALSGEQRATAHALVIWREECADREDKPVQKVLADAAIIEIAKRQPTDEKQLRDLRGLHEGIARRRGDAIVKVVAAASNDRPIAAERVPRAQSDSGDAALIVLSESLVRARAVQEDLAYELLATRSDLQAVVSAVRGGSADPDVRTLRGWRRAVVGDELLALLRGQRSLRIDEQLRVVVGD